MRKGVTALTDLAASIREVGHPLADYWSEVDERFEDWIRRPTLRADLHGYIADLTADELAVLRARSRETTTHFAWCLLGEPDGEFSFWLNEYKPKYDWRSGYADSVHNHRYHFCTTIISGAYRHERFAATLAADGRRICSARLIRSAMCPAGVSGFLLADEFHRIPSTEDGTLTFLVKSRPVREWSISYDPQTGASHRHVPVENRVDDLLRRL